MRKTDNNRHNAIAFGMPSTGSQDFHWAQWEVECNKDGWIAGVRHRGDLPTKSGRQLLIDFLKIKDRNSAIEWVSTHGFPIRTTSMLDQVLIGAASGLRFLREIVRLIEADDYDSLEKRICIASRTDACRDVLKLPPLGFEPLGFDTDLVDERGAISKDGAQTIKKCRRNLQILKEKEIKIDTPKAFHHILDIFFVPEKPADWLGIFRVTADPFGYGNQQITQIPFMKIMFLGESMPHLTLDIEIGVRRYARQWVARVINQNLETIHPSLTVKQLKDGQFKYCPHFSLQTPWQAMHMALYEQLCGADSLRFCPHPLCGEMFVPARSDQRNCGKEKCQRWVTRNKLSITP